MDELEKSFQNLGIYQNLYSEIKYYIRVIHEYNLFTDTNVIQNMDKFWKQVDIMTLHNLIDHIQTSINDKNNDLILYLKMDYPQYKSNILMFLDYLMHTIFY